MKRNKAKTAAVYGVIITLALTLSFIESKLPPFTSVPGIKLGLTNVAVLICLYLIDTKSAFAVNFLRIVLVSVLFGNPVSFLYSAAGGMLSTAIMALLKKTGRFKIVTVSIAGGVMHNIGQIVVAMIILKTSAVVWYLPMLWFSGILCGALIGVLGGLLCGRLKKINGIR